MVTSNEVRARIDAAVEESWAEELAWLQKLVRFESVTGHEAGCQSWLASDFAARGWEVDSFAIRDVDLDAYDVAVPMARGASADMMQVVARVPSVAPQTGRSLIMQGHVDVVPPGPAEFWTDAPFSGVIRDDRLYGRGAQDMKAGVAAIVFALNALDRAGLRPCAPVLVQSVTEEETTGNGALATLARGYTADACLIPEPTGNYLTRAQSGALWFKVGVAGNPGHVGRPDRSGSSIKGAFAFIAVLENLVSELNEEAKQVRFFEAFPDPVKLNVGVIDGGDWPNSVPAWCSFECRLGIMPGWSVDDLRRRVEATLAEAPQRDERIVGLSASVTWTGFRAEGSVLMPGSEAEAALARAHQAATGSPLTARVSSAANDTRYYANQAGIPALCYGPRGRNMHGNDEYVELSSLKTTTKILALFVAEWCGVTDA